MSQAKKENTAELPLKINAATIVLLLVILIPVIYTVAANLQKPEPLPPITKIAPVKTEPISPTSAIESAQQIANVKSDYDSYINLGLAYYNAGNFQESIKAWEKALTYNPKGDLAYNNIAAAYGGMQNYDAEIEICQRALAINPKLDLARRNMEWAKQMKNKK